MSQSVLAAIAIVVTAVSPAAAAPYWITYEGNDLPENEGWNRSWGNDDGPGEGVGAMRTVADGILEMDSLHSLRVYDFAFLEMPGQIDPEPSETFIAEWRSKVDVTIGGHYDASVAISTDTARQLGFGLFPDRIESIFEGNLVIPVTEGVFHQYRVLSSDMLNYDLYIDGGLAHQGTFQQSVGASKFGWGDVIRGAANRTDWDYVRFGVVPEPCSLLMLLAMCVCFERNRR